MARSIEEIQDEITENFAFLDDWDEKYGFIIDLGKNLEPMSAEEKSDDMIIKGCQSKVWLTGKLEDGVMVYKADSDAIITKGLVALVLEVFNHQKPKEIWNASLSFLAAIGLGEHLTPTRANGLNEMIKQAKLLAKKHMQ